MSETLIRNAHSVLTMDDAGSEFAGADVFRGVELEFLEADDLAVDADFAVAARVAQRRRSVVRSYGPAGKQGRYVCVQAD